MSDIEWANQKIKLCKIILFWLNKKSKAVWWIIFADKTTVANQKTFVNKSNEYDSLWIKYELTWLAQLNVKSKFDSINLFGFTIRDNKQIGNKLLRFNILIIKFTTNISSSLSISLHLTTQFLFKVMGNVFFCGSCYPNSMGIVSENYTIYMLLCCYWFWFRNQINHIKFTLVQGHHAVLQLPLP